MVYIKLKYILNPCMHAKNAYGVDGLYRSWIPS